MLNVSSVRSPTPRHESDRSLTAAGQRRKEHLRHLEATQKEHSTVQTEEIERLRQEIRDLSQENESLRRAYGSQTSSPVPAASSPGDSTAPSFPPYSHSASYLGSPALSSPVVTGQVTPNLVVVVPSNIPEIRRSLHVLFRPLLEMTVMSNPQTHLATLAALAPSLPLQLKPTELQLCTPHHLYIDMIASPILRDRLITVGPANSSAFMAEVCTIACDIEDSGQMTVWGEDWLNEFSWEFSAEVLQRWGGWLLTREWGQRANFWRRQRGAPTLPAWDG
jgi:Domain of unknown function (DUF3425)